MKKEIYIDRNIKHLKEEVFLITVYLFQDISKKKKKKNMHANLVSRINLILHLLQIS